ncbi:MAG: NADH-quinone oxidoreductase subunit K [Thermofilaceae archaeon]|nr:NADH-quinone oxidoreductase subunit K [Thermofilaceae archaeon]
MDVINAYTVAAAALLTIGLYSIAAKRNLIKLVMGIEIIATAVNLNFIGMGLRENGIDSLAQIYVALNMAVSAAVLALALAFVTILFRHYGTLDSSKIARLRW